MRVLAVGVLLTACAGQSGSEPAPGDAVFSRGMVTSPGDTLTSPIWTDGALSWFNGIWFNNRFGEGPLRFREINVEEVSSGLDLLIYITDGDDLPQRLAGLHTGFCGRDVPPDPYEAHPVDGFVLHPGKNAFPMIGVRNPDGVTGSIEGLQLVYESGGRVFVQSFDFRATIGPEELSCKTVQGRLDRVPGFEGGDQ